MCGERARRDEDYGEKGVLMWCTDGGQTGKMEGRGPWLHWGQDLSDSLGQFQGLSSEWKLQKQ